jgi:serine/threonine-protein kinase PRP4
LYELFTGRVAFPGVNNNDMLRLMMEIKGALPSKIIKRHRAAYEKLQLEPLFDPDGRFRQLETDPVTSECITSGSLFTGPSLIWSSRLDCPPQRSRSCG